MLELLQTHGTMRREDLAARLGVGERSVRRYVSLLQDMGFPVSGQRGRYGGYRLRPGFRLPPLMFTEDEALALLLGLMAARRLGLTAAAPATEGALAKVERVLPAALRERVAAVQEAVVLNLPGAARPTLDGTLLTLSAAARQGRRVRLRYARGGRTESERPFDPYGVVYHGGMWYAAGYCHLRAAPRVFRLDRVLAVSPDPSGETFVRPQGVDTLGLVLRSLASVPREYEVQVTLATDVAQAQRMLPPSLRGAALEATAEGVLLRCTTDSPEWLARLLAGLECDVVAHQPPELLQALRRLAVRLQRAAGDAG